MKAFKVASWLFIIAITAILLIEAKGLFIPIIIAVTIFYLIVTLSDYFQKIRIAGRTLPQVLTLSAAAITIIGILVICISIIVETADQMVRAAPEYQTSLKMLLDEIVEAWSLQEVPSLAKILQDIDLKPIAVDVGTALSHLAEDLILIIIYVIFLLIERPFFDFKLRAFFSKEEKFRRAKTIQNHINEAVKTYITLRTFTSLIKGGVSYVIMRLIGLDFAVFWAFLVFLLNFIPSIGPIVATSLAALFSLLQFQDFSIFLLTLLSIMAVELSVGHYVEPRLVGRTLNISPFVILFSLTLWGSIWGVIGMFLSIPLMVMIMIILAQFPETKPYAILLSEKGRVVELKS